MNEENLHEQAVEPQPEPTVPSVADATAVEEEELPPTTTGIVAKKKRPQQQISAQAGANNHLQRHRLSRAIYGWSYAFERPSPVIECPAFGIEIGIALEGTRHCESRGRGQERFELGSVSVFDLGEQYATHYEPRDGRGREVGFVVRTDRLDPERVMSLRRSNNQNGGIFDSRLVDLGAAMALALDRGEQIAREEIDAEVKSFVERHGELIVVDRLERARLDLVRHFDRALYMRHFAEIAGVHEETFARKFSARYGITPTRYRMLMRLKEAALLIATRPDLSVRDVAKLVGFEDPAYFHRTFAAQFGATPLTLGRGFSDIAA